MFSTLPDSALKFMDWNWSQIEPYYQDLTDRYLDPANVEDWLTDWSRLGELLGETFIRLYIATSLDTTDQVAEKRFQAFLDDIFPQMEAADQQLKEKLLNSKLEPEGFEIPLRDMRAEVEIFQEDNLPLLTQELKLSNEYNKITGAQTVTWEGEEITLPQLKPVYQDTDREKREQAWHMAANRELADRQAINELGKVYGFTQENRSKCWITRLSRLPLEADAALRLHPRGLRTIPPRHRESCRAGF